MKVTRENAPDNFSVGLALVDAIPVLLLAVNCITIGKHLSSTLFLIGALLCLIGGIGKVIWKLIVAMRRKNVWLLFVQMRILMPIGFLCMLVGMILCRNSIQWMALVSFPPVLFFALGILGMIAMGIFAVKLDNGKLRTNWIEQITNAVSQLSILIGLLLL